MNKKFLSALLAALMILSLAVPAMAAETTKDSTTGSENYTVDAVVNDATIKITVPSSLTGFIKLNPYKLGYVTGETPIREAIYSPVQYMTNLSNAPIGVTALVKATASSDVKLLADAAYTTAMGAEATKGDKNVTMYLEMLTVNNTEGLPQWAAAYDATKHLQVLDVTAAADGRQKKNIATMEAANTEGATPTVAENKGMIAFHFAGKVNETPDEVWDAANDKIALDITFTFIPLSTTEGVTPGADANGDAGAPPANTPASVSLDQNSLTLASGTATLTATYDAGDSGLTVSKYEWESSDTDKFTVTAGGGASDTSTTVTWVANGTSTITVTVTLSDNSTVTDTCTVSDS